MAKVALFSGSKTYFFVGDQYIRVTRGDEGPGAVDPGYPKNVSGWGWGSFGQDGIDAALHSRGKTYFFAGDQYIRVSRGDSGPGVVDPGYPKDIAEWGWPDFAQNGQGDTISPGIDAALFSGSKAYFFDGPEYVRVTRGETGPGTVDPGYPKAISTWGWGGFGLFGIDAALHSGSKTYFFAGDQYVRVSRGDSGPGTVDGGYPRDTAAWNWPTSFRNEWDSIGSNYSFDNGITSDQIDTLLERHTFAFGQIAGCGSLSATERAFLTATYQRPIRHGINTDPLANASAFRNSNHMFVNFGNLFPNGDDEIAQTLIHEMMHCVGYSHPGRCDTDDFNAGLCTPVDVSGDNGDYFGTPPLQAEICIVGNQSDSSCVTDADGACAINM